MFAVVYDCWGSLLWRADDALLYLRRLHTFGCGVNRRRWLVRSYGSSHGNYIRLTGPQTGPHKVWDNTHAHYITHRIHMAESINIVCHVKMKRKNGLNKAYPYRNQAQVQYINLTKRGGNDNFPMFCSHYKPCVTFSYLFHWFMLGLYIVLELGFYKGKLY
jgi:hypothetical protein